VTSGELSNTPSVEDDFLDTPPSQICDVLSTVQRAHNAKLVQLGFKHMPNPDPETLYYAQRTMASVYTKSGVEVQVCPERGKAYRLNVVIQLSKLNLNPMGSTKTHSTKNEPRGNRVSLILRKRKARTPSETAEAQ